MWEHALERALALSVRWHARWDSRIVALPPASANRAALPFDHVACAREAKVNAGEGWVRVELDREL